MKNLLFYFAALISLHAFGQEFSEYQDKINRLEKSLSGFKEDLKLPGLSFAVLKDQKVIWKSAMGYADIGNTVKATPTTQYQLASITKPIASIVLLQLLEQKKVNLDMLISDFNENIDPSKKVSLHHLLTHTSEGDQPGYNYNYNGNRYGLLGLAIFKTSGKSFRDLAQERIFDPLGMQSSFPNAADAEILSRFFTYLESNGKKAEIVREDGKSITRAQTELYDYISDKSRYGLSYWISTELIMDALQQSGVNADRYIHREGLGISEETRQLFREFYNNTEQDIIQTYLQMAKPYVVDSMGDLTKGEYSMFFNPGAGYISTVEDLAKFDIALDKNMLISKETKDKAFTAYKNPDGKVIPYGMGWFVQEVDGTKLVWHGGEWGCTSALYFKIPSENLTLIVLSNSRKLSQAFDMGAGNVLNSGIAREFYNIFFMEDKLKTTFPTIDLKKQPKEIAELIARIDNTEAQEQYIEQLHTIGWMHHHMQNAQFKTYQQVMILLKEAGIMKVTGDRDLVLQPSIAEILEVGNDANKTAPFSLDENTNVGIYSIGEGFNDEMYDYCWITDSQSTVVWEMKHSETQSAGGAEKNRKLNATISLPAGDYVLHYKSDDSHSYLLWNSRPPETWFWGVKLYNADHIQSIEE